MLTECLVTTVSQRLAWTQTIIDNKYFLITELMSEYLNFVPNLPWERNLVRELLEYEWVLMNSLSSQQCQPRRKAIPDYIYINFYQHGRKCVSDS